jgi:bifunctional UDP-N-acetylglucosamine pyrophosphorylase/glucosamine-1-phosphate N-acetyltransferase
MKEFLEYVRVNLKGILNGVKGCEDFLSESENTQFPWELLDLLENRLKNFECKIDNGIKNIKDIYLTGTIHIKEGTTIKPPVIIEGPVIIGENCRIGPDAYIRPITIIGNKCNIGYKTAVKNSIILNNTKAAHFNYIADSIIGSNCNLGAGSRTLEKGLNSINVTSNLRLDEKNVKVKYKDKKYDSKRRKLGAIIENNVKIGSGVVLNPGSYIEKDFWLYLKQETIKIRKKI